MADGVKKQRMVYTYKDTDLQYLLGKNMVMFSNGMTVTREEFDRWDKEGVLLLRLQDQADDPERNGWDFKYAVSTGDPRKRKGQADLVAAVRTEKRRKKEVAKVKEIIAVEQKKETLKQFIFSSAFIVEAIMVLVGIGSAIMSAYHTSTFLIQGGKPTWTGILTGIMMILFSATAFTAARYFFRELGPTKIFGGIFAVVGLAIVVYSMFSTLTVNFNQFKWQDDQAAVVAVADSEALAAHNRLIVMNQESIDEVFAEITRVEAEAEYWKEKSWKRYDDFGLRLDELRSRRSELRAERTRLEASTPELVEQAAVSQDTIYTFLGRIFTAPEEVMRFIVYVIPSCFYDIIAPFALSVVLLLEDNRRKRQNGAIIEGS
ncbi:hypothetical protein FACS1894109_15680 [Spirochaetia bacterium]|nr:hypothetical protein FACS1894109_15680 [Spirochaetia bacterium]